MPVLRLFAAAREAAGEARIELDGPTVGDVLQQARSRYGDAFTAVLERSRVWVNGQPAEMNAPLGTHDVVAVLPPVSGGAGTPAAVDPVVPAPPEAPPAPTPAPKPEPSFGSFPTSSFESFPRARELPGFSPLSDVGIGRESSSSEAWSADVRFEPLPAGDQSSADDLLDRLAGLPLFPAGDPVFDEPQERESEPLFREPPESAEPPPPPPPPPPLDPPLAEPPLPDDLGRSGWDPGRGLSWSVGDPTPPPERPEPDRGTDPERDLWSWPEGSPDDTGGEGSPSPFAPQPQPQPPPADWDRRVDPPAGEARSGQGEPEGRSGPDPRSEGRSGPGAAPPAPPATSGTSIGAVDEPAVRILGPDPFARPATTAVERDDDPAVRLIGPVPRPGQNGSAVDTPPFHTDAAASRAHAVGVLVDGTDTLVSTRGGGPVARSEGRSGPGAAATALAPAPAPTSPLSAGAKGGAAPALAEAPAPAPTKVKQKPPPLAVISKATRPHGRLGFLWVAITVGAVVAGPEFAGVWLAACAAVAGLQTAKVWRGRGERPIQPLAAAIAAALPLCAISGVRAMTGAIVGAIVVTFLARLFALTKAPARDVGLTLAIGLMVGLAVASVVLLRNVNIHAPLLLLAFTAAYDAGAYVVGTGASSAWEGPAAGVATIIPVTMLAAVILVPPFPEGSPLLLGLLAAALAPCGPLAGSALLGEREASAPALRRLDSLLVLGPVWAWCAAAFLG